MPWRFNMLMELVHAWAEDWIKNSLYGNHLDPDKPCPAHSSSNTSLSCLHHDQHKKLKHLKARRRQVSSTSEKNMSEPPSALSINRQLDETQRMSYGVSETTGKCSRPSDETRHQFDTPEQYKKIPPLPRPRGDDASATPNELLRLVEDYNADDTAPYNSTRSRKRQRSSPSKSVAPLDSVKESQKASESGSRQGRFPRPASSTS